MVSRKLFILLAAVLAAASLANATPAAGVEDARDATILLPAGHALVGRAVEGAWSIAAVPLAAAADPSDLAARKECDNDVPGGYAYAWYSVSTAGVLAGENAASQGLCVPQTHAGPVTLMQFRTSGDYYGSVYASGCIEQTGECGTYQVSCMPVGAALGTPGPGGWSTTVSGRDMSCTITSRGPQPNEWDAWEAYVGNAHSAGGSAYALFL